MEKIQKKVTPRKIQLINQLINNRFTKTRHPKTQSKIKLKIKHSLSTKFPITIPKLKNLGNLHNPFSQNSIFPIEENHPPGLFPEAHESETLKNRIPKKAKKGFLFLFEKQKKGGRKNLFACQRRCKEVDTIGVPLQGLILRRGWCGLDLKLWLWLLLGNHSCCCCWSWSWRPQPNPMKRRRRKRSNQRKRRRRRGWIQISISISEEKNK